MNPATVTINPNIPGLTNISTLGPCGWIVNFYYFALFFAGILAFGAIVFGGVKYATSAGNAHSQEEGRAWIWSSLIGILLLAGAWLILNTINPNLTKCQLPGLSSVATTNGGGGSTGSGGTPSNGNSSASSGGNNPGCVAPSNGPCSLSQIRGSCLAGNAQQAAGICNRESGGNSNAQGDKMADGNYASIGLFQINISADKVTNSAGQTLNCPSAFTGPYTSTNHNVSVKTDPASQALYRQCIAAMEDPATSIANTCADTGNGTNWKYWSTSGSGCSITTGLY